MFVAMVYPGYKTDFGECVCCDSLEYLKTVPDNSINLVITSPPFALQRKKEYGNAEQAEYVNWLCAFGRIVYDKLREDGSFVIDIGGAYKKGVPLYSLYQFRVLLKMCDDIGFHLAQPFYWHNPSALPAPIEWVNKRKIRAKTSVNTVWWLCKSPNCKANVRNVLTPYSDRMKKLFEHPNEFIKEEGTERPSGHVMGLSSWTNDNGGAIPSNLLQIPNSGSNDRYMRVCKKLGYKTHPARFPSDLPAFFIKFLTDEGDMVVDIFAGSNTTGRVAEDLKRRWLSIELSPDYVACSSVRFTDDNSEEVHDRILNGEFVELKNGGV